LSQVDVMDFAA